MIDDNYLFYSVTAIVSFCIYLEEAATRFTIFSNNAKEEEGIVCLLKAFREQWLKWYYNTNKKKKKEKEKLTTMNTIAHPTPHGFLHQIIVPIDISKTINF